MPKRRTFGQFLASSEDDLFWFKKRTCPPKEERMVSLLYLLYFQKFKFAIIVLSRTQAVKDKWSKLRQISLGWRGGGIKVDSAIDRRAKKNIIKLVRRMKTSNNCNAIYFFCCTSKIINLNRMI